MSLLFCFGLSSLLVTERTHTPSHFDIPHSPHVHMQPILFCGDDYLVAWLKNRIVSLSFFASFVSLVFFPLLFLFIFLFCLLWYVLNPLSLVFFSLFFFWFLFFLFFFFLLVFFLSDCSLCSTLCLSLFYLVLRSSRCLYFSLFHVVSLLVPHRTSSFLLPCAWLKNTIVAHDSGVCCSERVTEPWRRRNCRELCSMDGASSSSSS